MSADSDYRFRDTLNTLKECVEIIYQEAPILEEEKARQTLLDYFRKVLAEMDSIKDS